MVDGIMVQLPLPKHINENEILEYILPSKDVDGLTSVNLGKLFKNDPTAIPAATARGVMELLKEYEIQVEGKNAVVINRSSIVGLPIVALLQNENATVTICHSYTQNLKDICKCADILVVGIGKAEYITSEYIKQGSTVIDVGINRNSEGKLVGDVDYSSVKEICEYITPVPGGVGPMTIVSLFLIYLILTKTMSKDVIFKYIQQESKRQKEGIELIASENYVSTNVLKAMGSILTNKYSEGYPDHRYYGGNQYIDEIEKECISRAKDLFKAEHVNVQPYSGSPANLAVHLAFLNPADMTMGKSLSSGGHLNHGFNVSISCKYFDSVSYGVDENGYIDYDEVRKMAKEYEPKLIWSGFSAYSRVIDWKEFRKISDFVGAILVADMSHVAGLIAGGVYPSPVGIADIVTTTTHKTLRGPRGAMILCKEEYGQVVDKAVFPGLQGGPHNHTTAGIAIALAEARSSEFKQYAKQVVLNAQTLSNALIKRGYTVISGGTDNHMFLVDTIKSVNMSGQKVSDILEGVNITLNKNSIPNDERKPWDPSGIRIGTPAITTRGMKESEMEKIAEYIDRVLRDTSAKNIKLIKKEVKDFTKGFHIPGIDKL